MRRVAVAIAAALFLAGCATTQAPPERSQDAATTAKPAATATAAVASAAPSASVQPMEIIGKFALAPAHGPWDSKVTASATGMKPTTKYDLVWVTGKVAWKLSDDKSKFLGRDAKIVQSVIGSYTTDGNGAFNATFTVPQGFGYSHDVMVVDAEKTIRNKSLFDVDMVTTISPTSGPIGTPITVEVKGIGYQSYQNSFEIDYDNAYTGWVSSVTTNGYAKFVIPATGGLGTHYITLGHAETGAPYLNPQQQPVVASRPFPHLAFTVTDGPAVLPKPASSVLLPVKPAAPVAQGIWTDPGSGIVGAPVTLYGKGLAPNADIDVTWTAMVGNRTVTGFEERTKSIGKARTDAQGAFTWTATVPDDLGGTHTISAKIGDAVVAKTTLYVQANAFPLSVERGPSGTTTVVHVKGAGWTETEQIYHLVYDNAYGGYACAFNSAGDITVNLTVAGVPGWHFIDMYPGIYQGSELHPFNYKMPQLTSDADHPGEPQPIFRWTFFITAP